MKAELPFLIKDIDGNPIKEGDKFSFKVNNEILIGSFDWYDYELRYEIDIFDSNYYTVLYYDPETMSDFKLLDVKPFPKLMINRDKFVVIYATDEYRGIVVDSGKNPHISISHYSDNWNISNFDDYYGDKKYDIPVI